MAPLSFAIYDNGVRANARGRRASMDWNQSGKDVRDEKGGEQRHRVPVHVASFHHATAGLQPAGGAGAASAANGKSVAFSSFMLTEVICPDFSSY